jgi:hypothetical protein
VSEQREIGVLERVAQVLDSLGIPYAIGGSIASSMYGTVRFTRDADIAVYPFASVADRFYETLKDEFYVNEEAMQQALSCCGSFSVYPFASVADRFYETLKDEFYVNEEAMQQALSCCGSFSIIHYSTAFKIDLFLLGPSDFERELLVRSRIVRLGESSAGDLCFVSPEDVVLLKLRRLSEASPGCEHQWDDILGVLAVQGKALNYDHLADYARRLGIEELLERAVAEVATYI